MYTLAFYNNPTALILVLVVIILLFGSAKLPELMKSLGQSKRAFEEGLHSDEVLRQDKIAHEMTLSERERELEARKAELDRREAELRK